MLAAWKRWGYFEGIHYVVGRKPPKSFRQPIIDPKDYEHVISFYNGSVAVIISQDRPGSSNSLTLSWLLVDEVRSIAVYYREYSLIENLQLLGENYIKQMKRDLTPLTFQTSILCQRIGIAKDGFYSSMREVHKYDANDNRYLDTLGYDYDFSTLDARRTAPTPSIPYI